MRLGRFLPYCRALRHHQRTVAVMSIDPHDSRSLAKPKIQMSMGEVRVASLLCSLLIAGFAAIGIFLLATSPPPKGPSRISDCASVSERVQRLACYDELAHQPAPEPFKGATAPAPQLMQ